MTIDYTKEIKARLNNIRHTLHALEEEFDEGLTAEEVESTLKKGFEIIEE
ncbi:MAG: hypothetical protein ACE5J5_05375 [Candidatus Hydrothermarchaeales archaeon]